MERSIKTRLLHLFRLDTARIIVLLLLLIPTTGTVLVSVPMPAEYVIPGEQVPVSEIGIDGSVHFAVVYSGITESLYERLSVLLAFSDSGRIDFIPISSYEADHYEEIYLEQETLSYTVEQGIFNLMELTDENMFDGDMVEAQSRIDSLLEELGEYYGDSLGLMVAIGLYEEQHHLSFSDRLGKKISGTGTMEADGYIGSIGAMEQKLLGAEADGVDLFFIPKDYEWYGEFSNEEEARRVKDEQQLSLTIVPVETLSEAIAYLRQLDGGGINK